MPRTHDREHFFKYVSASTAEKILSSGDLQWSAPSLFNDPFDYQSKYRFPFTEEEAEQKLIEVQERVVFGGEEPVIVEQTGLLEALLEMRRMRLGAKEREVVHQQIRRFSQDLAGQLDGYMDRINDFIVQHLGHSRVLCVSETNDNVVMWSHYAEQHKGAVIKLNCVDAVDDNLIIARPVVYSKDFPEYLSADDWVEGLAGLKDNDVSKLAYDVAHIKHSDWAYEQEWRVHIPLLPYEPEGDGTSLYNKDSSVFGALYLGCQIPEEEQEHLIEIAERNYPHMEIHRAVQSRSSFSLEFERIT